MWISHSCIHFLKTWLYECYPSWSPWLSNWETAKSAAWVLCGLRKYDHLTPALQAPHWLPIRKGIEYKMAVLCYKCIHMLAPKYLCDMISIYTPRRRLRSSLDKYTWMYQRSELVLVSELSVTAVQMYGMIYLMICVPQNLLIILNKGLKPTFYKYAYIKHWF